MARGSSGYFQTIDATRRNRENTRGAVDRSTRSCIVSRKKLCREPCAGTNSPLVPVDCILIKCSTNRATPMTLPATLPPAHRVIHCMGVETQQEFPCDLS